MPNSVWIEAEFWALVLCSLLLPLAIIIHLIRAVEIRRYVLMGFALALLALACIDFVLLGRVTHLAHRTPDLLDDHVFLSEASAALYILPLVCAGVGINLLSFVITQHLRVVSTSSASERRESRERDPRACTTLSISAPRKDHDASRQRQF